jgi:hypothetical protein
MTHAPSASSGDMPKFLVCYTHNSNKITNKPFCPQAFSWKLLERLGCAAVAMVRTEDENITETAS